MRWPPSDRHRQASALPECSRHGCAETRPTTHEADGHWTPAGDAVAAAALMSEQPTREQAAERARMPRPCQSSTSDPTALQANQCRRALTAPCTGYTRPRLWRPEQEQQQQRRRVPRLAGYSLAGSSRCRIMVAGRCWMDASRGPAQAACRRSERGNTRKQPHADAPRLARCYRLC